VVLADTFAAWGRQLIDAPAHDRVARGGFGFALELSAAGTRGPLFSGMLVIDPLGAAFKLILVAAGLVTVLAFSFRNSRELHGLGQGELFTLVLALVFSCLLLAGASDS
jgi:NADH:ubiquinone oxidoreductase subunit 2 (subunit N)